jgi:hypothetical protein
VGLKFNGIPQLLAYANDVKIPGDKVNITKENTENYPSKEVGLEKKKSICCISLPDCGAKL